MQSKRAARESFPGLVFYPSRTRTDHLPPAVVRIVIGLPVVLSLEPSEECQAPCRHREPCSHDQSYSRGASREEPNGKSAQVDREQKVEDERQLWMRIP